MADKFLLELDLGNAAMSTPRDVAGVLREVAEKLDAETAVLDDEGRVRDLNGNTVGRWWFE